MEVRIKYSKSEVINTAEVLIKSGLFSNYTKEDMIESIMNAMKALALQPGKSNIINQYYFTILGKRVFEDMNFDANVMAATIFVNPVIVNGYELDYTGTEITVSDEEDE